jgi:aminoglycoside phosphotransferase (APT) family kinase protein
VLAAFLKDNWQRFDLDRFGPADGLSCVLATPRFRASSHVLFFVLAEGAPAPILVVKVPRLPADNEALTREATNLRRLQASRPEGFGSVPRVVAFENCSNRSILIETGLDGQAINVRASDTGPKIDSVIDWLTELHDATQQPSATAGEWYFRTVVQPLEQFLTRMPCSAIERTLVERTSTLAGTLREGDVSLVFEHRDFCPPNILTLRNGTLGVVDWELADAQGLPASDLFFFLALTAFAQDRARTPMDYLASFHRTFFGPAAWARPFVSRYARRIGLSHHLLVPLFVLAWSRYVTALTARLRHADAATDTLASETAAWLRANRFYSLWNYTIAHHSRLNLG